MVKAQVGVQAVQLYDYMIHNKKVSFCEGEDFIVFSAHSEFVEKYEIWLSELESVGWIKNDGAGVIILGSVITVYYRDSGDLEKEALLSRYEDQKPVIEKVLVAIGSLHKSGTLTEKQTLTELKYFDKYPREVVVKSAQVYLNLPIDKQHGERYLRGIIRNEGAQSNGRLQKSKPFSSTTSPIASHIEAQNKNDWVRNNIDRDLFISMSNNDQEKYIQQLESDYDSTRDN